MRPRTSLRLSTFLLLGYLTSSLIAGVLLAEGTLHPARRPISAKDRIQAQGVAHGYESELAEVAIPAPDGAILRGWSIRPRHDNGKAVILLHGLGDNRIDMIGYAELFLLHGFSVLMPDARAHGASGGRLATYGLLESEDIRSWFDWLQQSQSPSCIFGFGESMGAAQLLQALQAEPHFCAVAAESPFSSFREIAYDRVGQFFHTGSWLGRSVLRPLVEIAFGYANWKYKVDFGQVSPERTVAATKIRVLLIHGKNDSNIPVRHSRRIATHNPAVVLWEVPNTGHCGTLSTARRELERTLTDWFATAEERDYIQAKAE